MKDYDLTPCSTIVQIIMCLCCMLYVRKRYLKNGAPFKERDKNPA